MAKQFSFEGKPGFKAAYFSNDSLDGAPVLVRQEKMPDHFWQEGEIVTNTLKAYHFTARYSSDLTAEKDGTITLEVEADDGYRLKIDDKEVINAWTRNRWGARTYKLNTQAGKTYRIVLEYNQQEGKASVQLRTGHYERTNYDALIKRIAEADAIVYVGGISPQLEGEEMKVDFPGFNGGDRTSILLPAVQTDLLKKLNTTGKPVVFVMMTGSAIAIPWEANHVPAIINAWYGGESAGTAIADVLFGDYNPSGRLPVTFYKSDADLPAFDNYDMSNRTYRYFKGNALYPFGYGLSYTNFQYDQLKLPATLQNEKDIIVSTRVTNTGKLDGEEVVQLYVSLPTVTNAPIRSLRGFQRIALKAGESKMVSFNIQPEDIAILDDGGKTIPVRGKVLISIGGQQPSQQSKSAKTTVEGSVMIK